MINPFSNHTYEFWDGLANDLDEYFPDDVFHFGFDELSTSCWNTATPGKSEMMTRN